MTAQCAQDGIQSAKVEEYSVKARLSRMGPAMNQAGEQRAHHDVVRSRQLPDPAVPR